MRISFQNNQNYFGNTSLYAPKRVFNFLNNSERQSQNVFLIRPDLRINIFKQLLPPPNSIRSPFSAMISVHLVNKTSGLNV